MHLPGMSGAMPTARAWSDAAPPGRAGRLSKGLAPVPLGAAAPLASRLRQLRTWNQHLAPALEPQG